jgi:septal ring factor EnvC (AmiA/AmiB activator)
VLSARLITDLTEPEVVNHSRQESQEKHQGLELEIHKLSEECNQFSAQLKKSQADYQQLELKFQQIYQERGELFSQIDLMKMRLDLLEIQQSK